jgi:rhamnose transport system permease protein
MQKLLKSREILLTGIMLILIAGIALRFPGFATPDNRF